MPGTCPTLDDDAIRLVPRRTRPGARERCASPTAGHVRPPSPEDPRLRPSLLGPGLCVSGRAGVALLSPSGPRQSCAGIGRGGEGTGPGRAGPRVAAAPRINPEARALILRTAAENRRWGAVRIQGELRALGHGLSSETVRRYRRLALRRPPSPSWRTFLRNHRHEIWAADFLTLPTAHTGRRSMSSSLSRTVGAGSSTSM